MLYKGLLRLPLGLEGTILEVLSSVPLSNGGGVTGGVVDGATQPDVEAVPLVAASCRYNLSSYKDQLVATQKAEQSERPELQYTWCRVLMLWEIVR